MRKIKLKRFFIVLMQIGFLCAGKVAGAQTSNLGDIQALQVKEAFASTGAELTMAEAAAGQLPRSNQALHALAVALDKMGDLNILQSRQNYPYDAGYQDARELARNNSKAHPHTSRLMAAVDAFEKTSMRDSESHLWKFRDAARRYYEAARIMHRRLVESDPDNDEWQRALALNLSKTKPGHVGKEKIRAYYQPALDIHRRLAKRDPTNIDWQRDLATIYGKIGAAVQSMDGRLPTEYHEELAIRKRLFEEDETNTLWTRELAMTFDEIGAQLIPLGKINAARAAYTDGRGLHEDLAKLDPSNAQWQSDLATAYMDAAHMEDEGRELGYYRDALKIRTRLTELDPTNIQWQMRLVEAHRTIARFYRNKSDDEGELAANIAGQQQMAHFAQKYPEDRGWLFYQLEFFFPIGGAYAKVQKRAGPISEGGWVPDPKRFEAARAAQEATFESMVKIIDTLARQNAKD